MQVENSRTGFEPHLEWIATMWRLGQNHLETRAMKELAFQHSFSSKFL